MQSNCGTQSRQQFARKFTPSHLLVFFLCEKCSTINKTCICYDLKECPEKPIAVLQDVFTVSVGNLPPKATVLIKITYVAELQVDGELIAFNIPGSVAPWKKDAALGEKLQVTATFAFQISSSIDQ